MKKFLSLLVAALFLASIAPLALAQDEGGEPAGGEDTATEGGEKKEGEATDPWSVPEGGEKKEEGEKTEGEEAKPEIVAPTGYPTAEIDRPLALPKMTLEPLGMFDLSRFADTNVISLKLGAGFGIIDNLEAGLLFPLVLSPDMDVGIMPIYGLYELGPFMDGQLRTAGRLTFYIPIPEHSDFGLLLDAPVKFKFHDMFAAIGGVGLGLTFADDTVFMLNFDLGALVQAMEALAFELRFGIHLAIADNTATLIPLYFRGQYTLMGDLDVFAEFGFGDLKEAGADWIQFTVGAAYRLGL